MVSKQFELYAKICSFVLAFGGLSCLVSCAPATFPTTEVPVNSTTVAEAVAATLTAQAGTNATLPPTPTDFPTEAPANSTTVAETVAATLTAQASTDATLPPPPTQEIYPECVAYMEQGNFALAGECYEDYENFEQAANCYRQLTLAEPTNYWAFDSLARVYQIIDKWELALLAAQQALAVAETPEDQADAHLRLGVTHYHMGAYESAIHSLEIGVQTEQSIPGLHTNLQVWLAWAYKADGQAEFACEYFEQALASAQERDYTWAIQRAEEGLADCP